MSNAVYPTLAGLKWDVQRKPVWQTITRKSASGREFRFGLWSYPLWHYKLGYEFLRSDAVNAELQTLAGFFNARGGSADTFLFSDPDDNSVTDQVFGTGDGATTQFQLARTYGGYVEPIYDVNGAPQVYKTDWRGKELLYTTARTNLILRSEELNDAGWTKASVTVTADAIAAPDGATTADRIVETAVTPASPYFTVNRTAAVGSTTVTASAYVKAGERTFCNLRVDDNTSSNIAQVGFDLTTGAIGTMSLTGTATATATAVSVGNGWWRCTMTVTISGMTTARFFIRPALGTASSVGNLQYLGDITKGFYAWGAQIEAGSAPTSYIRTVASTVTVTDYTLSSSGVVTLPTALSGGSTLSWTGSFYRRCRFLQDQLELSKFMRNLWELRSVEFITVKP